jgi:hypothetical protein
MRITDHRICAICVTCVTHSIACAFDSCDHSGILASWVRIPLRCICRGSVDGCHTEGRNGEEIQVGSSRLHALIATVVTMNCEPWRDTDYNFVEKGSTSIICATLLLHCLKDDDLRGSDWLPVKSFSTPANIAHLT